MKKRLLFIVLLSFVYCFSSYSKNKDIIQKMDYRSTQISMSDGLSQNNVQHMFQDSKGLMWVSTTDGLNRYDGYEFKHFNLMDDKGLEAALIFMVDEDKDGNLWVATDNGVFIYFRSLGVFRDLKSLLSNELSFDSGALKKLKNIVIDNQGFIWGNTLDNSSILKISFDYELNRVKNVISIPTHNNLKILKVVSVGNELFFATEKALYFHDGKKIRLSKFFDDKIINDIALFEADKLLILCSGRVYVYDVVSNVFKFVDFGTGKKYLERDVNRICYHNGRVFLMGEDRIFYSSFISGRFGKWKFIVNNFDVPFSEFIVDNYGSVWTYIKRNGIVRFDDNRNNFEMYNGFGQDEIQSIVQDNLGHYWVGTANSGLYVLNSDFSVIFSAFEGETIQYITKSPLNNKVYFTVRNDAVYSSDDLLNKFDKVTTIFPFSIRKLLCTGTYLWFGTYSNGLVRLNLNNHKYKCFYEKDGLPSNIVRNILIDKGSNMWIATNKGLSYISHEDIFSDVIPFKNYLPDNYIMSLTQDDNGFLWAGTLGKGLKKLDITFSNVKVVREYNVKNGLSNNMINSIEKDVDNNIWIGTNQGINCIENGTDKIKTYSTCDGLQGLVFNELASCKSCNVENEVLIFGGVKGLNVICPSKIVPDNVAVRPILTDFKLFNVSIVDYPFYSDITSKSIVEIENVSLNNNQNSFSFNFSAPYFIKTSKIKYRYKLDGFDKSWVSVSGNQRVATYTNIPSGSYVFRVKSSNYDDMWNDKELKIAVKIAYPWWNTLYAYVSYVLFLMLFVYMIILYVKNNIKKKELVSKAYFEKQQTEKLLDVSTRFYTNISHELRTPLTLIISPLQLILNNKDNYLPPESIKLINTIKHNAQSMKRLLNNLMDFSKNESGLLDVHLSQNNIVLHIQRLVEQFEFWCQEKNIILSFESCVDKLVLSYDKSFIEQIIYNLISNAVKYSRKGDSIIVSLSMVEGCPTIKVKDTGIGMNKEQQEHLFERFYSKGSDSTKIEAVGIGLYMTKVLVDMLDSSISFKSVEGKGTCFVITLPEKTICSVLDVNSKEDKVINEVIVGKKIEKKQYIVPNLDNEKPLLLIVDDNLDICELLKNLFEDDFKIMLAEDGQKAWGLILDFMPDIIVSDVMMPIMDGYELCEKLKSDKRSCHIPIVLLTAKASPDDKITGFKLKADGYLTKPFDHAVLKEMVLAIIKNRALSAKSNNTKFFKAEKVIIDGEKNVLSDIDEKLVEQIESEFSKNLSNAKYTIAQLCDSIGVSRFILNKKFKAIYDATPADFLRDYRLKKAAELLLSGNHTIAEITYFVGFGDLKNFRVCFKDKFGILPQEYKKKYNI